MQGVWSLVAYPNTRRCAWLLQKSSPLFGSLLCTRGQMGPEQLIIHEANLGDSDKVFLRFGTSDRLMILWRLPCGLLAPTSPICEMIFSALVSLVLGRGHVQRGHPANQDLVCVCAPRTLGDLTTARRPAPLSGEGNRGLLARSHVLHLVSSPVGVSKTCS